MRTDRVRSWLLDPRFVIPVAVVGAVLCFLWIDRWRTVRVAPPVEPPPRLVVVETTLDRPMEFECDRNAYPTLIVRVKNASSDPVEIVNARFYVVTAWFFQSLMDRDPGPAPPVKMIEIHDGFPRKTLEGFWVEQPLELRLLSGEERELKFTFRQGPARPKRDEERDAVHLIEGQLVTTDSHDRTPIPRQLLLCTRPGKVFCSADLNNDQAALARLLSSQPENAVHNRRVAEMLEHVLATPCTRLRQIMRDQPKKAD